MRRFPIIRSTAIFLTVLSLGTAASCSLESKRTAVLRLDLSKIASEFSDRSNGKTSVASAPSSVSGFTCLGVNVVGPGIGDTSMNPVPNLSSVIAGVVNGSYCSYRGVVAGPIVPVAGTYEPTEIALLVPSGASRVVQIIGIVDTREGSPACAPATFANDNSSALPRAEYYEIGRAKLDLFSTTQAVTIASEWPAGGDANRRVNCHEESTPLYPVLSYPNSPYTFYSGISITPFSPTNTGGTITNCSILPALPTGLSLNSSTCEISGTPASVNSATNYTVTATNAEGSGDAIVSIEVTTNAAPIAYAISPAAFNEDTQSGVITLSYTDAESDVATSCSLSNLASVTVTTACACTAGVCTVRVTGTTDYNGPASFDYTVTAGGQTSTAATASLTINSIDDGPTTYPINPADFAQDTESPTITLSYTDPESDLATTCTILAPTNVTETTACACVAGVCTVRVTGVTSYNGPANFSYNVTANGLTSNTAAASFNILAP